MTSRYWATQPDGHILRYGELGLGAAVWLHNQNNNGVDCRRVSSIDWVPALVAAADATSQRDLRTDVLGAKAVRDKIHQDQVALERRSIGTPLITGQRSCRR